MSRRKLPRGARRYLVTVRLLVSLTVLGLVMTGLVAFTPGFDVSPAGLLIILALIGVPSFFYVTTIKTATGSYIAGVALLGFVGLVQSIRQYSLLYLHSRYRIYIWVFVAASITVLLTHFVEQLRTGARRED
jgi:hypothetical protein